MSTYILFVQSTGAVEYTDCTSTEKKDTPNECSGYDTKQSDGQVPIMLELSGTQSTLHCHRFQVHSGPEW